LIKLRTSNSETPASLVTIPNTTKQKQTARVVDQDESCEGHERRATRAPDDGRERSEGAQRRKAHDEAKNPEDDRLELADRGQNDGVPIEREVRGNAGQKRDEQHLENIASGEGVDGRDRDDSEQEPTTVKVGMATGTPAMSAAGLAWSAAPGRNRLPTRAPTIRPSVLNVSK